MIFWKSKKQKLAEQAKREQEEMHQQYMKDLSCYTCCVDLNNKCTNNSITRENNHENRNL